MIFFFILFTAPVSFSIKPKEDPIPTTFKPALPLEHSSDEETSLDCNEKIDSNACNAPKDFQLPSTIENATPNQIQTTEDSVNHSTTDIDQSDSFIRDTILEQQNLNDKKLVKRGIFMIHFIVFFFKSIVFN